MELLRGDRKSERAQRVMGKASGSESWIQRAVASRKRSER
jgi:hypothetical protein